jgi:Raf kinase inhibitor-like YbhB/YbcL family protein
MMRAGTLLFLPILAMLAADPPATPACDGARRAVEASPGCGQSAMTGRAEARRTAMALTISSPAFPPNGAIPSRYTCEGAGLSPPLTWSGVPEGARSLALVVEDPDAPSGVFCHWSAFDVPPDRPGLAEGYGAGRPGDGFREGVNDYGKPGYGPPCPPPGHGPHHYHFRLLALREPRLGVAGAPRCAQILQAARAAALAEAELVGTYERKR